MKKTFNQATIALVLCAITGGLLGFITLQEFDYKQAWSEGYKDGYCYDVEHCLEPIPPIPPIPRIQDTTYSNAYNRGFLTGLKAQKK